MKTCGTLLVLVLCLSEAVTQEQREALTMEERMNLLERRMANVIQIVDPAQHAEEHEHLESTLRAELNVTNYKMEGMAKQNAALLAQLSTLESRLTAAESQVQENLSALSQLKTNYDALAQEKNQLQSEVNELKHQTHLVCPSGWNKFGGRCYYINKEMKTWQQGREYCLSQGADLVIINSEAEQVFIRGLHPGSGFGSWIGLKRSDGKWVWLDGTPVTTQYWLAGYPSNSEDMNCVSYNHSSDPGTWFNGLRCSQERPSICKK